MRVARRALLPSCSAIAVISLSLSAQVPSGTPRGARDPAWAPDGRRLAFSYLDRLWTSAPDGRNSRAVRTALDGGVQRDPAFSPDGRRLAFAHDAGEGFDIYIAPAGGGDARRVTSLDGDERWPSWTPEGDVIFSHRRAGASRLHRVDPESAVAPRPLFADSGDDEEREGRVSPDGRRIAYISDRESEDGDVDVWVAEIGSAADERPPRTRLVRARGIEGYPSWSPEGDRLAYYAVREGAGAVWVTPVDEGGAAGGRNAATRERPPATTVLVSRRGGAPAWSPDGTRIAIAALPPPDPTYNGNPARHPADPPPLFASPDSFRLWLVDAPVPVDAGATELRPAPPAREQLLGAFDRVWDTLRRLYYREGPSADAWAALGEQYRPAAQKARDEAALERAIDDMIARQPLIKPAVESKRAVVVSAHPLASRAGALALERGGNIVDAAVAVSFALGVVEPEASGIGGDGMAVLYLRGMPEPVVIEYKDQVPIHATRDDPRLRESSGDGPAAANIPGVVAGLEMLYRKYGSGNIAWADLVAPAIEYADEGFELDEALPTSIAEGRAYFQKYPSSARIFLPGGRVPRPGERFVNRDYAATLRAIAQGGAETFYRGEIARRIADDMESNGGLITLDDLAQYRAIERRPLVGRYRGHTVYSSPPPVSTGAQLIETLHVLQHYRPKPGAAVAADADFLHYAIESWKARDQGPRIADPALWDVDLGEHLDLEHAAGLFERIDPAKASRPRAGRGSAGPPERIGRGTTAFAVADADGNMIALTQTLSTWGGTFYVSEGLGFLYNNHLRFRDGGAPGRFLPLARSSTTSVPTLIFRGEPTAESPGAPRLAVGAAGNAWIPASVYNIILNVIDAGMDAQHAIEAPRFLVGRHPAEPGASRIQIEDRIPRAVLEDLASRGHRFQKIGRKGEVRYGYAAAVVVDPDRRVVQGGAEPRRSHAAAAPRVAATESREP